jgi:hypothetical protein
MWDIYIYIYIKKKEIDGKRKNQIRHRQNEAIQNAILQIIIIKLGYYAKETEEQ